MSVSTDGQICFGIAFEDGQGFPWDSDGYDGDMDKWWIYTVHKYQPPFEIYGDGDGGYLGGVRPPDERISEYHQARMDFENAHPLPVILVHHCSGDYPMYILAIPRTVKVASRGYPEEIKPSEMIATRDEYDLLVEFCKTHDIDTGGQTPKWWLSSMWW